MNRNKSYITPLQWLFSTVFLALIYFVAMKFLWVPGVFIGLAAAGALAALWFCFFFRVKV